jgi:hypothetical protein
VLAVKCAIEMKKFLKYLKAIFAFMVGHFLDIRSISKMIELIFSIIDISLIIFLLYIITKLIELTEDE